MKTAGMLFVLFCATSLLCPGQQNHDEGTAGAVRALEREWSMAQSHNDNRALNLIFDNALVYVEYGKLISKGEYLSRIKVDPADVDQVVAEPITVRIFGTTAIVVGTYREKQAAVVRKKIMRWRFVDTWVYKNDGWVLVAAAAAPVVYK